MQKLIIFGLFALVLASCGKSSAGLKIAGRVECQNKNGLTGATLNLVSASGATFQTTSSAAGTFEFSGLDAGESYTLTASKSGSYFDGVTKDDFNTTSANVSLTEPFQILAVLKNPTASATVPADWQTDIEKLADKTATGLTTPVWRFAPTDLKHDGSAFSAPISTFSFQNLAADVDGFVIVGVKYGDVNGDFCN